MTALHLLSDLREEGVTFYPEPGDVITLTLPQGQRLHALAVAGRHWSSELYPLVLEYDDHLRMLLDCAMMSQLDASALAWAMLLAGYTPGN